MASIFINKKDNSTYILSLYITDIFNIYISDIFNSTNIFSVNINIRLSKNTDALTLGIETVDRNKKLVKATSYRLLSTVQIVSSKPEIYSESSIYATMAELKP